MSYAKTYEDRMKAARTLAAIALSELDVEIAPDAIMGMLTGKWARIAPLAHIIHDAPDTTKGTAAAPPRREGYVLAGYRYRYMPGSTVENPWRFTEQRPTGIEGVEVEPVYKATL